ncbi:MAG: hypothetical protein AB9880_02520 [Christensenellales bacterium]
MKRHFSLLLALLLLAALVPMEGAAAYPEQLRSNVGRSYTFAPAKRGTWVSSDPLVAQVNSRGIINFLSQGEAVITFTSASGKVTVLNTLVGPAGAMPDIIGKGILLALGEWQLAGGQAIPRANKYTFWLHNATSRFGWCGAFVNYCLESAGVPMKNRGETTFQPDGGAYAVREAAVPKIWQGFTTMARIAYVPQAGYEVIYGKRGSTPYIHVGLVTRVEPLGEGKYLLETVEGNLDSRILRYSYVYDAQAEDSEKNYSPLPTELQTRPNLFKYEPHNKGGWYITAFGATWY